MKINNAAAKNKFYWIYLAGIFLILFLPVLILPPWFFPPDWGKAIAFRSIFAILLFLFVFQMFYRRNEISLPKIKKNKIIWILAALFVIFLLASVFSVDPNFSFWGSPVRSGGFINYGFYIAFAVFLFLVLKDSSWQKVIDFSIFIGAVIAIIAGIQFYGLFSNIFHSVPYRPSSTSGNPIMLATYMLLVFFLTLPLIFKKNMAQGIPWRKIFYSIASLLFLFAIIITESRAAYFGMAIGAIYFFIASHKKMLTLKIIFGIFLILAISSYVLINTNSQVSSFLSRDKALGEIIVRTSPSHFVDQNRVAAWQVGFKVAIAKPILGWGPENFAVGFDKFYDPTIPYLGTDWWDRAHNAYIEITTEAGLPALIIYLSLFIVLFWQLQKRKKQYPENYMIYQGVQAAFMAYLIAIFFSFDDFSTYLTCFFLIGYSLHLIYSDTVAETGNNEEKKYKKIKGKGIITAILFLALIIFLWQYNLVPFQINAQINNAMLLSDSGQYDLAFKVLDSNMSSHSFLDLMKD